MFLHRPDSIGIKAFPGVSPVGRIDIDCVVNFAIFQQRNSDIQRTDILVSGIVPCFLYGTAYGLAGEQGMFGIHTNVVNPNIFHRIHGGQHN